MKRMSALALAMSLAFALAGCGEKPEDLAATYDLIPQIMVDGTIYMDTGHTGTYVSAEAGREHWDGELTSEVSGSEQPAENDQSNFGSGYGYRFGERDGTIEVLLNNKWAIFATEEARQDIQFPTR